MKKEKQDSAFSQLMNYAGSYKMFTYTALVLSAVSAVLALFPFVYLWRIIKAVINAVPDYGNADGIVHNGWMAVIMALVSMLIYFAALLCSHRAAFRVATNIKTTALTHIRKLPIGPLESLGSGKVRKMILESAAATETYLAHQLPDTANAMVTPLAMIVILFVFDWKLGLLSLIPVVIAFLNMFGMLGKAMAGDMKKYQDSLEDMNNEAVEYVRGMPVVKTFGQSVFTFKRFRDSISRYSKFCISYTKRCRRPMIGFEIAINSVFAFMTCAAVLVTRNGVVDEKFVVNFIFYVIFTPIISTTFTKIMFMSENDMLVKDSLQRINELLNIEPLKKSDINNAGVKDYSVELKNVTYRYAGASKDALSNLSLTVPSGKMAALIGPSGGGKSTVSKLAARFYDADKGTIKLGGRDISTINPENLLSAYSIVFQDVTLFNNTIMENIRIGRKGATDEEVINAAKEAQCDEFIRKLPQGYQMVIGENGCALSGGERQRISIARALLKDSPIILLDEATASLDADNETLIQQAISRLIKDKTVIIIAHRMRTVSGADKIVVLEDGIVKEQGRPEDLIKNNGTYAKMVKLQAVD